MGMTGMRTGLARRAGVDAAGAPVAAAAGGGGRYCIESTKFLRSAFSGQLHVPCAVSVSGWLPRSGIVKVPLTPGKVVVLVPLISSPAMVKL